MSSQGTMEEIHNIREKIYEEEKELDKKELGRKIREEAQQFLGKYKVDLKKVAKRVPV